MSTVETAHARTARTAREHITSRVSRAQTLQGVIHAVADEALHKHIPFDHCCLYLVASADAPAQVWRASRAIHRHEEHARPLDDLPSSLAEVLREGRAVFFDEDALQIRAADTIGVGVRSALALPLVAFDGEECFGALCFTSHLPGAYTPGMIECAEWLVAAVAKVTRRILGRESRHNLDETASEARRLKQYFVRTLVRDVRLPLAGVVGVLKSLESKLLAGEPLGTADRGLLSAAIEQGERVCYSVDDHLEVAQEDRSLAIEPQRLAARQVIEDAVATVRVEAALDGVGVDTLIASDTPDLLIDERHAARLLMHILDAALANTDEGGRIWVEAHGITGRREEDEGRPLCRIDIIEEGAGLPPEELPYIFDAFRPAPPSPRNATNSNIGLAIARRIALAHGGNITARTDLGSGTIYCVTLPAAPDSVTAHDS